MNTKKIISTLTMSLAIMSIASTTVAFAGSDNPNAYFLRKPLHNMTSDEQAQITTPPIKVDIVRSDAYKFLNAINKKRIAAGRDILSMTPELIKASNRIAYKIANKSVVNNINESIIVETNAQTAEIALNNIFNKSDYMAALTNAKFTQIGIGCNYSDQNLYFTTKEDKIVEEYDKTIPVIINNWIIVLK